MASNALQGNFGPETPAWQDSIAMVAFLRKILKPLASMKLAVAMFALAILSVFFGTLGQVNKDIWEVIGHYFRFSFSELFRDGGLHLDALFARINLQIFFPPSFFPSHPEVGGHFYFPKGWVIGAIMAVNLVAAGLDALLAHSLRLVVGARGIRLWAGLAVILFGGWITKLVIDSGSSANGFLDSGWLGMFVDPRMRILWQLVNAEVAALVLLAGFALVFKRRCGVALLHSGVLLMMLSEFMVGTSAVETQMSIKEGETVDFVHDIRVIELAVVDRKDAQHDHVVVVPRSFLKTDGVISNEQLPFDIEVVQYLQNTRLRKLQSGDKNLATAGAGLDYIADEVRAGVGTDTKSAIDISAAYLKFLQKGTKKSLGTHLLSLQFALQGFPEQAVVDGKSYDVYLRFKRIYKPYSVHLIDVEKEDYPGTSTPRNYSSDVQLIDPTRDVDRKVHIWMNNPLRFAGETFYQSDYGIDPESGTESTTLSVVKNTGWMIPYVSCMIVVTGMIVQFGLTLLRFVKRMSAPAPVVVPSRGNLQTKSGGKQPPRLEIVKDVQVVHEALPFWISIAAPLIVVALAAVLVAYVSRVPAPREGEMDLYAFGKLPLLYEGRVKPFDTLARNSLVIMSGKQTFVDNDKKRQPAIRWLLDVICDTEAGIEHKIFRIDNPDVLTLLGLQPREGFLYSSKEIEPKVKVFSDEVAKAGKKQAAIEMAKDKRDVESLSPYEIKLLELDRKAKLFMLLRASFHARDYPSLPSEKEIKEDPAAKMRLAHIRDLFSKDVQLSKQLANMHPPLAVPTKSAKDGWESYMQANLDAFIEHNVQGMDLNPATAALNAIFNAYYHGDVDAFNNEVRRYQSSLDARPPKGADLSLTDREAFFNHMEPFIYGWILYTVAFALSMLGMLLMPIRARWVSRAANWAAFSLLVFTVGLQTWGLWERICISGRPPVTNLYSSAIFIGWGAVVLALILELISKLGVANIVASVAGFAALFIAHTLSADGDTFIVLQAVLDTQFWLATHVVCITFGYATTGLAGLLGIVYIIANCIAMVAQPANAPRYPGDFDFREDVLKVIGKMIYGVICFATLCSFFGTVLGGLWADDSWGRFWGWDPKENGALIIVLWNLLILHARWSGMVKDPGVAALAVLGNIVVGWSWFGVNQLGVGLHTYGFTDGTAKALWWFAVSQIAIAGFGAAISWVQQTSKSRATT